MRRPAEPGQIGEERKGRHGALVAIEEVAAEQDRAGDRQGRPAPDERGQGERDGTRREPHQPDPDREADCRLHRNFIARQAGECDTRDDAGQGEDDDLDQHRGQMGEELLDCDPPHPERGRRDELEAALADLRGKRARQGENRPERRDEGERSAALPRDRAAKGIDGGRERIAIEPCHDRREAVDEVGQFLTRREGGVCLAKCRARREEHSAEESRHDEQREA